jgi:hypothetical protein
MIWACHLEKLLDVIRKQMHLVLNIMLDSGHELLIGVTSVLVITTFVTTSGNHDMLGPLPWPPPTTFDAPLYSLVGGYGRCCNTLNFKFL